MACMFSPRTLSLPYGPGADVFHSIQTSPDIQALPLLHILKES